LERYWVEDCAESSHEAFFEEDGCAVQLWITRVQLLDASNTTTTTMTTTTTSNNNNNNVNNNNNINTRDDNGQKDATAFPNAAAAVLATTAEPTTRTAPPSLSLSEPREGAFVKQQRMTTREVEPPQTSSSKREVTDKKVANEDVVVLGVETSKQPDENDEKSSFIDDTTTRDSTRYSPGDEIDSDDNGKSAPNKDTIDQEISRGENPTSFAIGIQRHVSARGPIQPRPRNNNNNNNKNAPFFQHLPHGDCGDGILNPHPTCVVADKYWAQRKHLFGRYDDGVLLDAEGWYSVTPEAIANHIAQRMVVTNNNNNNDDDGDDGDDDDDDSPAIDSMQAGATLVATDHELAQQHHGQQRKEDEEAKNRDNERRGTGGGMIVLDAFAGVGGNSIAFARRPEVDLVVCVDTNDTRLRMAANNCRIYNISTDKVVFIHGDATIVLAAYQEGEKKKPIQCPQQQQQLPTTSAVEDRNKFEIVHGYKYGGMELLPDRLDAIFLSPPWGGSDYGDVGRRAFDLECIHLVTPQPSLPTATAAQTETLPTTTTTTAVPSDGAAAVHGGTGVAISSSINGKDLLALAAKAVDIKTRNVAYFLPRNTNGKSVAHSASTVPGIRLLEMEQNYLNYKLKTITLYASSSKIKSKAKQQFSSK
jgi:16S rRNA G966 N2-methylase RsmD